MPCPGGTSSNLIGATSQAACVSVLVNYWAPLGSKLPEACPPSGFYCPGAAADTVNDPGGSKPIIVPTGGSKNTEHVPAVTKAVTLDLSCSSYVATAARTALATQYGVTEALITLSNPCKGMASRRARLLQISNMGLTLSITIATSATAADGSSVSATVADLLAAVQNVDDAALGSSLGTALGMTVTVTASSAPQQATIERAISSICPKGKWCTAGLIVDCPISTYNNETGRDLATACRRCPEYSTTLNASATSIADCVCQPGFIRTVLPDGSSKCECAAGFGIVNGQSCSPCSQGTYKPDASNEKVCARYLSPAWCCGCCCSFLTMLLLSVCSALTAQRSIRATRPLRLVPRLPRTVCARRAPS